MNTSTNAICVMITSGTLPAKLTGATISTTRPGYTWIRVPVGSLTRQQLMLATASTALLAVVQSTRQRGLPTVSNNPVASW